MDLHLTPAALNQIRTLGGLRISLEPGGCYGTAYVFALAARPGDLHLDLGGGLNLALSPGASAVLVGARLDYSARIKPSRFRILAGPNTLERCACNRSFGRPFPGKATPQCRAYVPMPWDEVRRP